MAFRIVALVGPEHETWIQTHTYEPQFVRSLNVGKVRGRRGRWEAFAAQYFDGTDEPFLIPLGETFGQRSDAIAEVLRASP